MPNRSLKGYSEKQIYRNERFTKGVISTRDPLFEGSLRGLYNFKISNQNASLENRDPFITVPLYNLKNEEVKLSKNAFVFALNDDTEYAYILDPKQEKIEVEEHKSEILEIINNLNEEKIIVIDGDTFISKDTGIKYRLALIDTPELEDDIFEPTGENTYGFSTMGYQAKHFSEEFLKEKSSNDIFIVQFPFQAEKTDQFGREIVFVFKFQGEELKCLNVDLLGEGLAHFFNQHTYERNTVDFYIPSVLNFYLNQGSNYYSLYSKINSFLEDDVLKGYAAFGNKYSDLIINIYESNEKSFYSKIKIYKIKKETDLKKIQFEEEEEFKDIILKRVLKEFEINEAEIKKDLEIFNDDSLKFDFINDNFSILNTKYGNQVLIMMVSIKNQFNIEIYRGPIELSHTVESFSEGLKETFFFKTYKKPEMRSELKNLTNYKPNILDANSIIPQKIIGRKANVLGYSSPSIDTVLLNVKLNTNLKKTFNVLNDEIMVDKFFKTDRPVFEGLQDYKLTPYFKAPIINNTNKNKYMYRWDLVNMKEIDFSNEENLEEEIIFRSAWTKLNPSIGEKVNISLLESRIKNINTKLKNIRRANEFYLIKRDIDPQVIDDASGLLELDEIVDSPNTNTLKDLQDQFNDFIQNNSLDYIKQTIIGSENQNFNIKGLFYKIVKVKNLEELTFSLNKNREDDSFTYEETYDLKSKTLNLEERENLFKNEDNEHKKISFIFSPVDLLYKDTLEDKLVSYAYKTQGVMFNLSTNRKEVLPVEIDFKKLIEDNYDIDFKDFLKNGINATFYLYNYESEDSLTEEDEFYDLLAYKKTSATYSFRKGQIDKYSKEDFIDDKFDKESEIIKYSKYTTVYQDRLIVYGNPKFKNTVILSEEGSPYYFSLYNLFEFDHEVIHVQTFKTIALVFTINDVWVIYPWETTNPETGITTVSFRYKKILYNISTEVKNKTTIKNITRYITLMSNNVLYLIKPSTYISDDTEFYLNILSKNIDAIVKNPLEFINERLKYFGIFKQAEDYKMNLNATDNYIKLYYTSVVEDKHYTLILTYDILNDRWSEEDTMSFGHPKQIYLLDSTTKYEMLTEDNDQLFITFQTDKYKNMMLDEYNQSYYDLNPYETFPINYFIDSGYLKTNEHLKKRYRQLQINMKNIDCKKIMFSYNFSVDDRSLENNFEPTYTTNTSNEIIEVEKISELVLDVQSLKQLELEITKTLLDNQKLELLEKIKDKLILNKDLDIMIRDALISDIGTLDNFLLDFSNLEIGDIVTVKQNMFGIGRLPRLQMSFSTKNRFYILSFGIIYSEHGGK